MLSKEEKKYGRLVGYSIAFIILLVVTGAGLYYALYVLHVLPLSASGVVKLSVAAGLGLLVITILGREVSSVSKRVLGDRRGSMVFVVFRFLAYIALALVLLALVGVSGTDLLAGGTFAGLVLGLAAQTVLSNVVAGLMIILARPYEVDDRVTFFTWQFGVIAPAYPPKFYSNDLLIPGYSGTVRDVGLAYTIVQLDEGPLMKVPNSMMAQAAIVSHSDVTERWVRTKYEIPASLKPDGLVDELLEKVKKNAWVTKPESVRVLINAATSTVYVVSVDAICKGQFEDQPRSSILLDIMRTVVSFQEKTSRDDSKSGKTVEPLSSS